MSFGKNSSFVFIMQDGKLVNVGRTDNTADKQPLDDIEKELWRIFGEHKALKASHEKLEQGVRDVIRLIGNTGKVNKWKISNWIEQALKEAGEL